MKFTIVRDRAPPKNLNEGDPTGDELNNDDKPPRVPTYGRPRELLRPRSREINKSLEEAEQTMWNKIYRRNDNRLKPVPILKNSHNTGRDHKSTYAHGNHGASRYQPYTRRGPRMPYEMWPQRVGDLENFDFEPKPCDTYFEIEKEWYRGVHALTRHLWQVDDQVPTRRLGKIERKKERVFVTRPQGPMRRTRHVEIDRSEIKPLPKSDDRQRLHHVRAAINKLGLKTDKCARDFASQTPS